MSDVEEQPRPGWRRNRLLGPIFGVAAIGVVALGFIILVQLEEGPTVDAGRWFRVKANDVTYRVDVVRNNRHGLLVNVRTWNTTDNPVDAGQAIFTVVARAGDRKVKRDCRKLGCMGGVLRPGETRTVTIPFRLAGPADSLEFLDVGDPFSNLVALVRLRPRNG